VAVGGSQFLWSSVVKRAFPVSPSFKKRKGTHSDPFPFRREGEVPEFQEKGTREKTPYHSLFSNLYAMVRGIVFLLILGWALGEGAFVDGFSFGVSHSGFFSPSYLKGGRGS